MMELLKGGTDMNNQNMSIKMDGKCAVDSAIRQMNC